MMAETRGNQGVTEPNAPLRLDTRPALASINYNDIISQERNTSSDDEAVEHHGIHLEDARTAIGVSISREQTRLTSPTTPAVEKAAAIEKAGGFFAGADGAKDTLVEESEEDDDEDVRDGRVVQQEHTQPVDASRPPLQQHHSDQSQQRTPVSLPSPWRVETKPQWETGTPVKGRGGLFDGIFNRRRASSGPESSTVDSWQKSLLSSLPSIPKPFSLNLPFTNSNEVKSEASSSRQDRSRSPPATTSSSTVAPPQQVDDPRAVRQTPGGAGARRISQQATLPYQPDRAQLLRRSTSDHSLTTLRTLSMVESLGDDSRFEDVSSQVNSRMKAIKDSWQDASIKLPSLPNISVANLTPDFLRERSSSMNKRQSTALPMGNGVPGSSGDLSHSSKQPQPVDPITRQPYDSAKAALADANSKAIPHPHFHHALEQLEGDIVVLGGYRGSILRSATPPNRQLWVPVKVGLNLRKANLEVGFEEGDDARASETIIPGGMLTHIGPVDMSRRLFKRLRTCTNARTGRLRVHDYGYDWRLDPSYLSGLLIKYLEKLPCNRTFTARDKRGATVIAHSLGGLITRHAVNQRPDLFKGVVYAGVPNTCVNILGPLRNGDEVLLSDRVLTAQVNFSIRTSFALLPLSGRCFFDKETRKEYPVDFFDPQTWVDYRLSPCLARPLPPLTAPPKPGGISGYVSSMANALPSLPGRSRKSSIKSSAVAATGTTEPDMAGNDVGDSSQATIHGNIDGNEPDPSTSPRTAVTISRELAMDYLTRTLASVKKFKQELNFIPAHADANLYPPIAVIYGKSTPTVFGAKVDGREGIKHADAYDELAFASGDGVVLARAAMVPAGYKTARGGIVSSERGHVTLLSDLEAVGKCLNAVIAARRRGVGYGN